MFIGRRIHVMGNTGAGKSTLAERLAGALGVAFVELDALNWQPNWTALSETSPREFERRLFDATRGEAWVVAGSYTRFCQSVFWARLETVVFIDLPLPHLVWRVLRRSWRRWRSRELLWGMNCERFWPQLKIWDKDTSLLGWAIAEQRRKRRDLASQMSDPRWRHIRFLRLTSSKQVEALAHAIERRAARTLRASP